MARLFSRRLRTKLPVERLILFGSRARGDNLLTSDFDFVVVSRAFRSVPFVKRASLVYAAWVENHRLEAICYTPEEWNRLKDRRGILLNAQQHGLEIA